MVGLDAAGKTTILYKLKLGEGEFGSEVSCVMRWRQRLIQHYLSLASTNSCHHDSYNW